MNEVGFCPVVSGVLSNGVLSSGVLSCRVCQYGVLSSGVLSRGFCPNEQVIIRVTCNTKSVYAAGNDPILLISDTFHKHCQQGVSQGSVPAKLTLARLLFIM